MKRWQVFLLGYAAGRLAGIAGQWLEDWAMVQGIDATFAAMGKRAADV